MAYTPIAKIKKFTSEENNAQNNDRVFQVILYFLQDTGETEAVTTYLGCFHRNLHQIQAIQADYFTASQILNQFICGLCSSFFQHVHPMHSQTLQDAVTNVRDFELTELKANHAQAVNLVMNRLSDLDSKLKQLTTALENITFTKPETNQKSLTSNILPATISNNGSLAAIFSFKLKEPVEMPLFSKAILESKSITVIYTNAKVDGHQVDCAANVCIITTDGVTKTPIGEIDNFPFKVNNIIIPIKIVARNFLPWELGSHPIKITRCKPTITTSHTTENNMATQNDKTSRTTNHVLFVRNNYSIKKCGTTFLGEEEHAMLHANTRSSLITGNYNISEVRSNLYNNLVHYSRLETKDLNSKTLAIYFQELNYNIIKYCEEKYPVQSKYSLNFESKTETSNKGKQKVKQYSRTTPNTPILPKTTAKHLQTPEQRISVKLPLSITSFPISFVQSQTPSSPFNCFSKPENFQSPRNLTQQQEPISTNANIIDYLQENESNHSESLESEKTEPEPEEAPKNEEEMTTAYIAKIPEFTAELKDKLIKKVHPHAPADLATAIRHAKSYEMAMKKANHTKLVNLAIGETSSVAEKKIDQFTKKSNNNRINLNNQLVPQNSGQQRPNHYHTQPSYLIIPEESDFQQTALSEDEVVVPRSNPSNHTISPAQIAQNTNLSDIFPFEFEANESPFLLSNAAVNEQKAITTMYTEATVKGKPIRLILDNRLAGSIITYQLMQQLKQNVDKPAQTVIVIANKKAPVFEFEEEKEMPLTETYMALESPSNWAEKTEQEIFKKLRE
ncbi:hypothetical protein G9A89_012516 [Geosiphon pyriformis]|nr:hypothetical protein G9A89_012516 [Geosiphon pyriformis]